MSQKAVKIRITGTVQGVGYRHWVVTEASRRGLNGWVRNRTYGSVEAFLSGQEAEVSNMVEACHSGPNAARVESVIVEPALGITPSGFVQKPTV
jgi:acylphosphatase